MSSITSVVFSSSAISTSAASANVPSNLFQQTFKKLGNALNSGNLPAAQSTFKQLQKAVEGSGHYHYSSRAGRTQSVPHGTNTPQLSSEFQALNNALQSGNLVGAQSAFSNLVQTVQIASQSSPAGTALSSQNDSSDPDSVQS